MRKQVGQVEAFAAVPPLLARTVLFAAGEARAKQQSAIDERHLLLGALRDRKRALQVYRLDVDAIRSGCLLGDSLFPDHFSSKAKEVLNRSTLPDEVIEELRHERWARLAPES